MDCLATSLLALLPWRFSLHHLKRTSFRAAVFSVLGMPRNHMALSPSYMVDVLVLSHQFQSALPMPQQQYVAGHYPGAKTTVSWANPVFSSSWLHTKGFSGHLHNSHRLLSAHGKARSSRVHQRTAEAWLYPLREMNWIFWVVVHSSVSTHLTVLITGHNDESESMIRHMSQSRLRNSESSQTFEQCSCTSELVIASALLWVSWVPIWHTHNAFAVFLSQCVECVRRRYSVKLKVHITLAFGHFPTAPQPWQYVTTVGGLPERALSITCMLLSLKCLHHWNTQVFHHHTLAATFQVFHYRSSQV